MLLFPGSFLRQAISGRAVLYFRGRGPASCTVWERVEVRSGSLAKLFLWSSLSFRKLAFPLEKPSRDILVVQSSGACEMSARPNQWQERELWNGSSIDRVSGRRELLPSASEQILSPLRFQETRGGSGVCHFGFKAQVLSVPVDLARGPMGSSAVADGSDEQLVTINP